jgi:hypothetical protein
LGPFVKFGKAELAYIEHDFPIEGLNKIAQKEGNARKPIYQMHNGWARRLQLASVEKGAAMCQQIL